MNSQAAHCQPLMPRPKEYHRSRWTPQVRLPPDDPGRCRRFALRLCRLIRNRTGARSFRSAGNGGCRCIPGRLGRTSRVADQRVDIFVCRGDHGEQRSYRRCIPFHPESLAQYPIATGNKFHHRLVGLDFSEHVAGLHGVALVLQPFDEPALFHRWRERLHYHFGRHSLQSRYMTFLIAAMVFAASGFAAFSRFFAYGIGVSAW